MATIEELRREIKNLKCSLTKLLNKLNPEAEHTRTALLAFWQDATKRFDKIKSKQEELLNMVDDELSEDVSNDNNNYQYETQIRLSDIQDRIESVPQPTTSETETINTNIQLKLPELTLPKFNDNQKNRFHYVQFRSGFVNALSAFPAMNEASKFLYLRGQLGGKAYSLIENLAVDATTYELAMQILDKEFLDRTEIFTATMSSFFKLAPATDLDSACEMVLNFKTNITELNKLRYDFSEGEAGMELVSMILRTKLPKYFTVEVARICGNANPTYMDVLECYQKVRQLLFDSNRKVKASSDNGDRKFIAQRAMIGERKYKNVESNVAKTCKFCDSHSHYSARCSKYSNYDQRLKRTKERSLCKLCLSSKHESEGCIGMRGKIPYECKICKSHGHVTPMCTKTNSVLSNATTSD